METGTINPNLSSILHENRVFPPPAGFAAQAHVKSLEEYEALYRRSIQDPESFWAGIASELHWFTPWTQVLDWQPPLARWFVGGKINLCYNCVDRHALSDRKNKTAILWEGEPGETRTADLRRAVSRGAEIRQRTQGPGGSQGRPGRGVHGDDPGVGHCPAGLCAHWRGPFRHLRRIRGQCPGRPHQRRILRGRHHPGWVLPPRAGSAPEGDCRRGPEQLSHGEAGCCVPPHRIGGEHEGGPRSLVARSGGSSFDRVPGRAARRGRSAVHPLHFGDYRQAQGPGAHHGRLFGANLPDQQADLRSQTRRCLLVYGRYWLGHGSLLRSLRHPAERRYHGHV